jgi:hypothetical protein
LLRTFISIFYMTQLAPILCASDECDVRVLGGFD